MAFGATLSITVNSVAKVLNRINQDNYGSEYLLETSVDSWNLKIRNTVDTVDKDGVVMKRHNFYLDHITFPTSTDLIKKESVAWTIRRGKFDGPTQIGYDAKGVLAALSASSYAMVDDMVAGLS